jgi:hypothetical protein
MTLQDVLDWIEGEADETQRLADAVEGEERFRFWGREAGLRQAAKKLREFMEGEHE